MSLVCVFASVGWPEDGDSEDGDSAGANDAGTRVHGRALSSTSVPPVLDDPPRGFVEDADERPGDEATAYTGLDDYQLKDGFQDDDKKRWADTDFVHWLAQGATLVATGQVHDSHAASTSQVSSQAWGAQVVEAEVTPEEGDYGEISATNRISFGYVYTVSGPAILEAKVLLTGACVDIHGKLHTFNLSDVRSEKVTEHNDIERTHVRRRRDSGKVSAGAQARTGSRGASAGASWNAEVEAASESEDGVTIHTAIDRAYAGAGGEAGTEPAVVVTDMVSGPTLLKRSYAVYSQGSVLLAARGAAGATTVVLLDRFKIENSLKVFTKAVRLKEPTDPEPTPGDDTPGPGDPNQPGGPTTPGAPPASGGSGEDTGSGDGSEATGSADPGTGDASAPDDTSRSSLWLNGLEGLDGMEVRIASIAPQGLSEEPGSTTGELHLVLSAVAPRDLVFSVVVDPPSAAALLQGSTLTIPAGGRFVGGSLEALETGPASVSVHLLDAGGGLTGRESAVSVDCFSHAETGSPELYACGDGDAWHAGRGATIFALRGHPAPALVIGRLGFAGYETASTSVSIAVDDPDGVLPPMPAVVTIPAGEAEARVELPLQDVEGIARLRLTSGDSEIDVYVVSRTQSWEALPVIRIPLGATAVVPFELRWPEQAGRTVSAGAADATIARPIDGGEVLSLVAGQTLGAATVRGDRVGQTEIRYETEGLAVLAAMVEVVPARVRIAGGELRISNLPTGTEGTISLAVPEGVSIADIVVPPEASSYLSVTGCGSDCAVLRFTPSPDVPALLSLGIRIEGSVPGGSAGPIPVDIDEDLREDADLPVHNTYRIESE